MYHSILPSFGNGVGKRYDMVRKKKPVNNMPYPDYVIETVARCLWPHLQAFFEREEEKREFGKKANDELSKQAK